MKAVDLYDSGVHSHLRHLKTLYKIGKLFLKI